MQYDLIIHNAQLHRHSGLVEIAVQDGRFARISSEIPPGSSATREIDAGGRLVIPPSSMPMSIPMPFLPLGSRATIRRAPCSKGSRFGVSASRA